MYSTQVKLSTKSEYACLALIALTEHYRSGYMRIIDISKQQHIPKKYLEQILLSLKGARYVKSKLGPEGGYALARPPETISLAEIIRLMDGALAPSLSVSEYFYKSTPIERHTKLHSLLSEIRNYISEKLENTNFTDLTT